MIVLLLLDHQVAVAVKLHKKRVTALLAAAALLPRRLKNIISIITNIQKRNVTVKLAVQQVVLAKPVLLAQVQPLAVTKMSLIGAGLGLRKSFIDDLLGPDLYPIDFLEIAPENWYGIGGQLGQHFRVLADRYPITCHGLSLSLGGPAPLNEPFILAMKQFLTEFNVSIYSDHLSFSTDDAYLYDLLPIPFTIEAVKHTTTRIKRVQELLERRIAIENISFYTKLTPELTELEFLNAVLAEADCDLHLDVNNIYVNSLNHQFDASQFLAGIKAKRVSYIHIAGHFNTPENIVIDTHGSPVIKPVWDLLAQAYRQFGNVPTLLERDVNIPALDVMLAEVAQIKQLQQEHSHHVQTIAA